MISVLIVDDSPTIRTMLRALLETDGDIRVVGQAADGRQAVELAHRLEPDLITMDVEMPEMDGLAATRHIMADIPTPIIIVTAQSDNRELNVAFEAMQAGALDVLAKPDGIYRHDGRWAADFVEKVKCLAEVRPWEKQGAS